MHFCVHRVRLCAHRVPLACIACAFARTACLLRASHAPLRASRASCAHRMRFRVHRMRFCVHHSDVGPFWCCGACSVGALGVLGAMGHIVPRKRALGALLKGTPRASAAELPRRCHPGRGPTPTTGPLPRPTPAAAGERALRPLAAASRVLHGLTGLYQFWVTFGVWGVFWCFSRRRGHTLR